MIRDNVLDSRQVSVLLIATYDRVSREIPHTRVQESREMFGQRPNSFTFSGITMAFCLALLSGCFYDGSTPPDQSAAAASAPDTSSAPATSSTSPPPSTNAVLPGVAAAPTNLSASTGNASVTLTWTTSTGASSYNVKRAASAGGSFVQIAAVLSPSYADTTVTNGTSYYYVVTALNAVGESASSTRVTAVPAAPAAAPGISLSPTVTVTPLGGKVQFVGVLNGAMGGASIVWSMQETGNVGTIASNGLYTAPTVAGTYHVVATSSVDSKLAVTAAVTVTAPPGTVPALVPGVWTNITPPAPGFAQTYGSASMDVSPVDPNVIYLTIDTLGLWKTTDRGSNWTRLGVPGNYQSGSLTTTYLDSPIHVRVDPSDPNHLVATQGVRGATQGFWVSHDAGNTWSMPQGFFTAAKNATIDITSMAIDPTNFKHILLGSHSPWPNSTNAGIMETTDGGQTWILHPGDPSWPAGSVGLSFLYHPASGQGDANTWIVQTDGDGFWRTTNAGASWVKVSDFVSPHGGAQIYYAKDGTVYSGAAYYPVMSHDNGATWQQVQTTGLTYRYYYTVYGDGTTLYTQLSFTGTNGGVGLQPYMTTPEGTGAGGPWTPYQGAAQTFNDGPFEMQYDAVNGIMYSANWTSGFWALKVLKP